MASALKYSSSYIRLADENFKNVIKSSDSYKELTDFLKNNKKEFKLSREKDIEIRTKTENLYLDFIRKNNLTSKESLYFLSDEQLDKVIYFYPHYSSSLKDSENFEIFLSLVNENKKRMYGYTYDIPLVSLIPFLLYSEPGEGLPGIRISKAIINPFYIYKYESLSIYNYDDDNLLKESILNNADNVYTRDNINIAYYVRDYYNGEFIIFLKFGIKIALDKIEDPDGTYYIFSKVAGGLVMGKLASSVEADILELTTPWHVNYIYAESISVNYDLLIEFYEHYYDYMSIKDRKYFYNSLLVASIYEPSPEAAKQKLKDLYVKKGIFKIYEKVKIEIEKKIQSGRLPASDAKKAVKIYDERLRTGVYTQRATGYCLNFIISAYKHGKLTFLCKESFLEIDLYLKKNFPDEYRKILPSQDYIENKLEKDIFIGNQLAKEFKKFFLQNIFYVQKGWGGEATYVVNRDTVMYLYMDESGLRYIYKTYSKANEELKNLFKKMYAWTNEEDKKIAMDEDRIKNKKNFVVMIKKIIEDDSESVQYKNNLYNI